jgi:lipoate---protein ligase
MNYIALPDIGIRRLSFYLAMEEYVARNLDLEECFFMWQVHPTVIFGRNQLMENEVNLTYVRDKGIEVYRRKSGGGCVYADLSNIMFCYITKDFNVGFTFDTYLRRVAYLLQQLGVPAVASGRNDILINERKVSGNAFYRVAGKSIVHGTMLFDTDVEEMVRAITPSDEKLISKGVESVRKRVTNLSEHLEMDIEAFKAFVRNHLCDGERMLTAEEIAGIEELELEYLAPEWIQGNNPRYSIVKRSYVEAGEVEVRLELKNNIIKGMNMTGDYFLVGDLDKGLFARLKETEYTREAIEKRLEGVAMEEYIHNLTTPQFVNLLFGANS